MLKPTLENPPFLPCFGQFEPRTPEHFRYALDGPLYDTRDGFAKPLRPHYREHHRNINTPQDLLSTLRAGPYAWPGGYLLYFLTSDGGALSFETVRKELRYILDSIRTQIDDGWCVVYCGVNWEDADLFDDHSGERIPSAYGEG